MTNHETKTCPECAEPIKRDARICPRCRQWQTLWSIQHPATFCTAAVGWFMVMGITSLVLFERAVSPQPDFSKFRDQIAVTESKMATRQSEKDNFVFMVGIVTNRSDISWKELQFECRFFGPKSELIDAKTYHQQGAIFDHGTMAFRFDLRAARPLADYASHQVTVRFARNAKGWP